MKLIIFGPPGSGKGTYSEILSKDLDLFHFSMGDALRNAKDQDNDLGDKLRTVMGKGDLVLDDLLEAIVRETLKDKEKFILDGFPRRLSQCLMLDSMFGTTMDAVIELKVAESVLVDRLLKRKRSDDTEKVIKHRQEVFQQETMPVLAYLKARMTYLEIDGEGEKEEVCSRIKAKLETTFS